jgi:hypothetical protein
MKRLFINIAMMLILWVSFSSCYKDVILPAVGTNPNGPPKFESFANDIQPIFTGNCALSGCHVVGSQTPYLVQGMAYEDLLGGGYVNTVVPTSSTLYQMINGDMEVHIPSATERQAIYDWIRNGAPNN